MVRVLFLFFSRRIPSIKARGRGHFFATDEKEVKACKRGFHLNGVVNATIPSKISTIYVKYYYPFFFQVAGMKRINRGKSSSLPASIVKESTYLDKAENCEKLPVGPTSPSPGPVLFKVAATLVKVVRKSKLSSETITKLTINNKT